jgi:hypothetical protein
MSDDIEIPELDARERALFAALPRDSALDSATEDRVVSALKAEGFLQRRPSRVAWARNVAAAVLLLAIGGYLGATLAQSRSIEGQLARGDLSVGDRVLLLQRAGSAYVQAAHGYAAATAQADSSAIEVARQVLLGAAHAVARNQLDGGIAPSLTALLRGAVASPRSPSSAQPVIWF